MHAIRLETYAYDHLLFCVLCLTDKDSVYSHLKSQPSASDKTAINVQSTDGFTVEQHSRVRTYFLLQIFAIVIRFSLQFS